MDSTGDTQQLQDTLMRSLMVESQILGVLKDKRDMEITNFGV